MTTFRSIVLVMVVLAGAGCGGTGSLVSHADAAADLYLALDLNTGRIAAVGNDQAALSADERYQRTHVLFRRIPGGTTSLGCEGDLSTVTLTTVTYGEFFCAVHEVTQEQWTLLAGTTPWTSTLFTTAFNDVSSAIGARLPAWGMSYDQAAEAAATWSRDGWTVRLPTADQWEIACRAGVTNRLFPWGNQYADPTIGATQAVFALPNTAVSPSVIPPPPAPRVVGQGRLPNAWGLFDLCGNIAEMTVPDTNGVMRVRGGSYDQPLMMCRASEGITVPRDLGLPTVGVRLVLQRTIR